MKMQPLCNPCVTLPATVCAAASPEGVPTDATCALAELAASPPGPDVIVNINADSTAAFAAWAMGSAADAAVPSDDTGAAAEAGSFAGEPEAVGEGSEFGAAGQPQAPRAPAALLSAERAARGAGGGAGAAAGMTPSREVTPQLRRRSSRVTAAAAASVRPVLLHVLQAESWRLALSHLFGASVTPHLCFPRQQCV